MVRSPQAFNRDLSQSGDSFTVTFANDKPKYEIPALSPSKRGTRGDLSFVNSPNFFFVTFILEIPVLKLGMK